MKRLAVLVLLVLCAASALGAVNITRLQEHTELYVSFDNATSTKAYDHTGTYDGTAILPADINPSGKLGKSFRQNGSINHSFYFGDILNHPEAVVTVGAWINSGDWPEDRYIISAPDGASETGYSLRSYTDGSITWGTNAGLYYHCPALQDDLWYHIVGVASGSSSLANLKIYINGTDITSSCTGIGTHNGFPNGLRNFTVGLNQNYATGKFENQFVGGIDELFVMDIALNTEEIQYLYMNGAPNSSAQYPFTGAAPSPPAPANTITILSPTNGSWIFGLTNISINTSEDGYCKYSTNPSFVFATQGVLMSGNGKDHSYIVNSPTGTLSNYSYYYKCNQSNGTVTSAVHHHFTGKDLDWVDEVACYGDSLMTGTFLTTPQIFCYKFWNWTNDFYYYHDIAYDMIGEGGTCFADYPACAGTPRGVEEIDAFVNNNSRIFIFLPNQNDNFYYDGLVGSDTGGGDGAVRYYNNITTFFNRMKSDAINTTLMVLTQAPLLDSRLNHKNIALFNTKIRQAAILYQFPLIELTYLEGFNSSQFISGLHWNEDGMDAVTEILKDAFWHLDDYVMTADRFNIYHYCTDPIIILNHSVRSPTMNCQRDLNTEWLVILNITSSGFYVEDAPAPFYMNISKIYLPNTNYSIYLTNNSVTTKLDEVQTNANGDLLGLYFGEGSDMNVSIIASCTPLWSCSGYASCNTSDLAPCNTVTDANSCGLNYTGDYSEFTPQACDYCSPVWVRDLQDCIGGVRQILWNLTNNATCCQVTLLSTDCDFPYATSESCSAFDYTTDDLPEAILNIAVTTVLVIGVFLPILVVGYVAVTGWRGVKK